MGKFEETSSAATLMEVLVREEGMRHRKIYVLFTSQLNYRVGGSLNSQMKLKRQENFSHRNTSWYNFWIIIMLPYNCLRIALHMYLVSNPM